MNRYPPPTDLSELISILLDMKTLVSNSNPLDIPPTPEFVMALMDDAVAALSNGFYLHSGAVEGFTSHNSAAYEICAASGLETNYKQLAEKLARALPRLTDGENERVYDICFISGLRLNDIAEKLGLENPKFDAENRWEWVVGNVGRYRVDITRDHTVSPHTTPTRLFLVPYTSFPEELCTQLVSAIHAFSDGQISIGAYRNEEFHTLQDFYAQPAIDKAQACSIALDFARKEWSAAHDFVVKDVKFLTHAMIREDIGLQDYAHERVIANMPEQWWVWMDCYFGGRRDEVCVRVNPDTKQPNCMCESL